MQNSIRAIALRNQIVGPIQGIAIIENVMEHLAHLRKEDPLDFRLRNLNRSDENEYKAIQQIINEVRRSSNYDERHRQVSVLLIFYSAVIESQY